jgi:EamA domain-containing membrane protein RarD
MQKISILALLIAFSSSAWASATRYTEADALRSSDHSKTWALPAASSTLAVATTPIQESPSGSDVTFTLSFAPVSAASLILTLDGLVLTQGSGKDYTLSGNTITMATAPETGQILWASYSK